MPDKDELILVCVDKALLPSVMKVDGISGLGTESDCDKELLSKLPLKFELFRDLLSVLGDIGFEMLCKVTGLTLELLGIIVVDKPCFFLKVAGVNRLMLGHVIFPG